MGIQREYRRNSDTSKALLSACFQTLELVRAPSIALDFKEEVL